MKQIAISRTDLAVSSVILGLMRIGTMSDDEIRELVGAALAVLLEELLDEVHAQVEGLRVDVEVDRARTHTRDRAARREERVWRRDDFVARTQVVGHQRDQERIRA